MALSGEEGDERGGKLNFQFLGQLLASFAENYREHDGDAEAHGRDSAE